MGSYTKQLMELAKGWLAANPDPKNPFLTVPRQRFTKTDTDMSRYDRAAKQRPELAPFVERLREQTHQILETEKSIQEHVDGYEKLLNTSITGSHQKLAIDHELHADRGRWMLAWARQGYNVIELSADFVSAMLLTDASQLDITRVRMPFGGILMIIPDGFARGSEGLSYTKIHLTEIPRIDQRQLEAGAEVSNAINGLSPEDRDHVLAKANVDLAAGELLSPLEKTLRRSTAYALVKPAAYDPDANDTSIHIYASDGVHALDTRIDLQGLTWQAFEEIADTVDEPTDREASHTIRRIVFGALTYISAVRDGLEPISSSPPPSNSKSKGAEPRPTRWDIGRTIRIDPNLVRTVRAGSREVAFRLKHRHIVRAHFRQQPHGVGRSERKEIWIAPHWKGPKDGAALVHTYKVGKDSKETT